MPMILLKISAIEVAPGHRPSHRAAPFGAAILWAMLIVTACAPVPTRSPAVGDEALQAAREIELAKDSSWSLVGRLAISQGNNGGNARIEWQQAGADFDIRLSAPITGQSWRLRKTGGKATLEGLDGGIREGADAESLFLEATGWPIPLTSMSDWVRGARAVGASELSFNPHGLPATLAQNGWSVEFKGWSAGTPALPEKIFARKADASVRLVIERWESP